MEGEDPRRIPNWTLPLSYGNVCASVSEEPLQPSWDTEPELSSELLEADAEADIFEQSGVSNLHKPARFVITCLLFLIALRVFSSAGELIVTEPACIGAGTSLAGMAMMASWGISSVLSFVVIFGYLMWLVGAAHNAQVMGGSRLRITPGWQAVVYFIPLFWLILPLLGMHEIVSRSRVKNPDRIFFYTLMWWFTWCLGIWGIVVARMAGMPPFLALTPLQYYTILYVTATVLTSLAAIFLIILIRTVTRSQGEYARNVALQGQPPC